MNQEEIISRYIRELEKSNQYFKERKMESYEKSYVRLGQLKEGIE